MGQSPDNKHEAVEPTEGGDKEDLTDSELTEDEDDAEKVAGAEAEEEPTDNGPKRHSASSPRSLATWLALGALVVGLGALGVGLFALLRPPPQPEKPPVPPGPTAQQVADAKKQVCDAYATVQAAVNLRSNANPGPDPAAALSEVVGANARQALTVGGAYLLAHLDPATPAPLAAAIHKFVDQTQAVAMYALAGVSADDQAQVGRIRDFVSIDQQITGLCK